MRRNVSDVPRNRKTTTGRKPKKSMGGVNAGPRGSPVGTKPGKKAQKFARGLTNCRANEVQRIKGLKTY